MLVETLGAVLLAPRSTLARAINYLLSEFDVNLDSYSRPYLEVESFGPGMTMN